MLERLYYTYKLSMTNPKVATDLEFSSEFNKIFLSSFRKVLNLVGHNLTAMNTLLNFDFSVNVSADIHAKKIMVVWYDLTSNITDNPSNDIFELLEESFGDFTAQVAYGGKSVPQMRD